MDTHLHEKYNLNKMSKELNYSPRHLRRVFLEETRQSLEKYDNERKMINAYYDIVFKEKKLYQVASKYGYGSYDSFLRAFKRVFNESPSNIDKNIKVVYKEIVKGVTRPIMFTNGVIKHNSQRKHYKNLYWQSEINHISSYLIYDSGLRIVNLLEEDGFGEHYIHKFSKKLR